MKYNNNLVSEVKTWIEDNGLMERGGASLAAYLKHFGITHTIHYRWRRQHTEYRIAIDEGKAAFKAKLENDLVSSLYRLAMGGRKVEKKITKEMRLSPDGKPRLYRIVETTTDKPVQPNLAAIIFLLTNIDPEHWSNTIRHEVKNSFDDFMMIDDEKAIMNAGAVSDEANNV